MKNISLDSIIYLLVGLILGTIVTLSIVLIINNKNDSKLKDNGEEVYVSEDEIKEDEDVDVYFERLSNSKDKNVIKSGFVKVVDFLFYNKPIKGKTFSDLKESAKLKVIQAALYLDSKIDKYFPGYKEKITTTTKDIYSKVKIKAVELYYKTTSRICDNNKELCESARENFQKIKSALGITWEYLKDLGGDGLDELRKWYESFREA